MKKSIGYISMCLIWGTTWMAIKVGLDDLTPFFSLGLRFSIAGICLLLYLLINDRRIIFERKQVSLIALITILSYILPYSLVYWGEQFIYSDLTAIIFAMLPVNVAILSLIFLKEEKLTLANMFGIVFGFIGIITIFYETLLSGKGFDIYGMIAIYLASVSQAVIAIILKKYKGEYHPLRINLVPMLLTGIVITLFSFLVENMENNNFTLSAMISVGYLSVFGTVIAFAIYFWIIKQIKLILLSAVAYILPVIAVFVGWIFLDEELSKIQLLGFGLIVISIGLINYKKKISAQSER